MGRDGWAGRQAVRWLAGPVWGGRVGAGGRRRRWRLGLPAALGSGPKPQAGIVPLAHPPTHPPTHPRMRPRSFLHTFIAVGVTIAAFGLFVAEVLDIVIGAALAAAIMLVTGAPPACCRSPAPAGQRLAPCHSTRLMPPGRTTRPRPPAFTCDPQAA